MLATALVNDLNSIDLLRGQAPHPFPRLFWRISLDGRAIAEPGVLTIDRGRGMTAGSGKRCSGCQQAGPASSPLPSFARTRRMSSSESPTDLTVVTPAV